jgi:dTDP-4-amino-4,6-dideoxygalactose transaminase
LRSGFDATLQALALPRGSKVLVSDVTIPDMIRLLDHHGLVPVPLSVAPDTLTVDEHEMEAKVDQKTRAALAAHLFGSRMCMDGIASVARRHGLFLFEDCAQAYIGDEYRGHPNADVAMFSFGPIKTATALGGAMLVFRDEPLCAKTNAICETWPRQPSSAFFKRLLKFTAIKLIATENVFGLFHLTCRLFHRSHDEVLRAALRGFSGDLFEKIRQRASKPLMRLLLRRLSQSHKERMMQRVSFAERLRSRLHGLSLPGQSAAQHSHWVLPICSRNPHALAASLQSAGFDATRYGSSMMAVGSAPDKKPHWISDVVYLPMQPEMSDPMMQKLACTILEQDHNQARSQISPVATCSAVSSRSYRL